MVPEQVRFAQCLWDILGHPGVVESPLDMGLIEEGHEWRIEAARRRDRSGIHWVCLEIRMSPERLGRCRSLSGNAGRAWPARAGWEGFQKRL